MAFSAPAKIATGLGATSTVSIGTVLTVKYVYSLYSIEKLAADKDSKWKIKAEGPDKVTFTATVATDNETLKSKYGLSEGVWTCSVKAKSDSFETLKSKLKGYFGLTGDISTDTNGTEINSIPSENKISFVNSCSKYRNKTSSHSHNKVNSEIEIDSSKLDEQLESLFGGIPLFKPDKDAISASSWTITTTNPASGGSPKTITVKSVITSQPENSSWTCTITTTAKEETENTISLEGIKNDLNQFLNVDIDTTKSVIANSIKQEYKVGFVNSCARNRKANSNPSATQVEGELKLELEKPAGQSHYQFKSGELDKVFEGTWINKNS